MVCQGSQPLQDFGLDTFVKPMEGLQRHYHRLALCREAGNDWVIPLIMENQMEKKMENEMETGGIWGLRNLN